jgi:hypothetical protein
VPSLRIGPLLVAIAICVLFALFGSALVGEPLGTWYDTLDKPWFLVPLLGVLHRGVAHALGMEPRDLRKG